MRGVPADCNDDDALACYDVQDEREDGPGRLQLAPAGPQNAPYDVPTPFNYRHMNTE